MYIICCTYTYYEHKNTFVTVRTRVSSILLYAYINLNQLYISIQAIKFNIAKSAVNTVTMCMFGLVYIHTPNYVFTHFYSTSL